MSWTMNWFEAGGTLVELTDPPYVGVRWQELKGASTVPFRAITERVPLVAGSVIKNIDVEENEVDLTLIIRGDDETDLWNRLSLLTQSFNPLRGEGTLRVVPPHGTSRELRCLPISGFRINEETMTQKSIDVDITLLATKPYWRSTTLFSETYALDSPPQWFPIFPLALGGDAISSLFTVYNFGHVPSYPIWTINGPGSNPKLTKTNTGEYIELSGVTLDVGQFITIDTENRTVLQNDGTNLFSKLTWGSSFWLLDSTTFEEGNNIKIEMDGATTDSSIVISYRQYYLGMI